MESKGVRDKVYRGISSQTIVTVLSGVLEISVFALMSRLLSQEDFGYYAIIVAVVSVFQCLTEAGLGSAVIQNSDAPEGFISTALGWSVILGVVFSLLSIALAQPLSELMGYGDELTNSLRWMSITILLCSVNSVARALFMKKLDFMKFGWCQVAAYVISSGLGVGLAIAGYGVKSVVVSAIANAVLMTIILFGVRGVMPSFRIYTRYNRDILSYGGWLTGSAMVLRITTELDKFILTHWIPVSQIGAYNRPSGFISSIMGRITGVYDVVLFPILSSFNGNAEKMSRSFLSAISLISWFSVIVTAVFILGSHIIINIFFGADWLWLMDIFMILSLSMFATAYNRLGDCFFRSLGFVKHYFYMRLAMCILTLVCVYVGCQYGIHGVAIGFLFSRTIESIFKLIYFATKLSVKFLDLIKSILEPSWMLILLSIACFYFMKFIPNGEYVMVFLFGAIFLFLSVYFPKMFGSVYYENIYMVAKLKLDSFKKNRHR